MAMVSSFWPHLIYTIRSRDPKVICSMAWRPQFLAYETYYAGEGGVIRRFDGFLQVINAFFLFTYIVILY
jgi:hypothetical protein